MDMCFSERVLSWFKAVVGADRKKSSLGGGAAKARDKAEAERIILVALAVLVRGCIAI